MGLIILVILAILFGIGAVVKGLLWLGLIALGLLVISAVCGFASRS